MQLSELITNLKISSAYMGILNRSAPIRRLLIISTDYNQKNGSVKITELLR